MSLRIRQPQAWLPVTAPAPPLVSISGRPLSDYDEALFQGRLWTPAQLRASGKLAAWHDASQEGMGTITSASGAVSAWADRSGFGRTTSQATGAFQPTFAPNGWKAAGRNNSCLTCSSDATNMAVGVAYSGATGMSVHAAVRNSGAAAERNVMSGIAGAPELRVTSTQTVSVVRTAQVIVFTSTGTVPTGHCLLGMDLATNRSDIWVNGSVETSANDGAFSTPALSYFHRGTDGAFLWDDAFGEILITSTVLTASENAQLQGYLAWKWGTVDKLPASHLYKKQPPLIGGSTLRVRQPQIIEEIAVDIDAHFVGTATIVFGQSGAFTAGVAPAVFAGSAALVFGQTGAFIATGSPAVFAGSTALVFGQTGALKGGAVFAGSTALAFSQSGALKGGDTLAGSTALAFGQTGALGAPTVLAGSTPLVFGQSGAFFAGGSPGTATFTGSIPLQFGQTGTFSVASILSGATPIIFGQTGTFVAGPGAGAVFAGSTTMVFGAGATFTAGSGVPVQPEGPRGAWISDEKVERARRKRWKRAREAQEELRLSLELLVAGKPKRAREALLEAGNAIELGILEAPGIDQTLIEMRLAFQSLLAKALDEQRLRDMDAAIAADIAEEEAAADEEAGMVALLMSI